MSDEVVLTWTEEQERIKASVTGDRRIVWYGGTISDVALEAIRRVGAAARHAKRVADAADHFGGIVGSQPDWAPLVADAIRAAIDCIGMPGSRSGSSPPSWLRDSQNVDAMIAAWLHVLRGVRSATDAEWMLVDVDHHDQVVFGDQAKRMTVQVLREHILALALEVQAREFRRVALDAYYPDRRESFEAQLARLERVAEAHAAMVAARRPPREGGEQ